MCGICGILGHNDNTFGNKVTRMMSTLVHRGPDGSGSLVDDHCALGHRRLAVIDLTERARQPMENEDGTIWSIVNGEVYNYKDLREQLRRQGHIFKSDCDSEVLVHLYEQYGATGFLRHLRGMFALAIYDSQSQTLVLARDPVGKKPLYYYFGGDQLIFASEIKALFEAGAPKEVNYEAIPSWMLYQYTIGEETLFRHIYKVRAGTALIASALGTLTRFVYWSPDSTIDPACSDLATESEALRRNLEESTRLRLQADVPVGAFLSGGVDSSAVIALYRRFATGKLHTFTASFENKSEAKYAKRVSEHLGTEYHEVLITSQMVFDDIRDITWHYDEPLGDAAIICNYYLAKEAKKYVTVVLAGEGGDELFGGYPWHPYANFLGRTSRIPYFLRKPVSSILNGDVTSKWYPYHRFLSTIGQPTLTESLLYPTTAMSKGGVQWVLKKGATFPKGYRDLSAGSDYAHMLGLDFLNMLPERFLMKADKGTMSFGIEERLPLLDKEVVELAFKMSPELKRKKLVMRQSVSSLLPDDITWRPKQGFGTPYDRWMCDKGPIRNLVLDRLATGKFLIEICNGESLFKMLKHLIHNQNDNNWRMALGSTNVLWSLFTLQLWHDVWF